MGSYFAVYNEDSYQLMLALKRTFGLHRIQMWVYVHMYMYMYMCQTFSNVLENLHTLYVTLFKGTLPMA
jgi:hypothetical protein